MGPVLVHGEIGGPGKNLRLFKLDNTLPGAVFMGDGI